MPDRMPKYTSDRPSDKMSEYIPNRLPENMSDRTSEYIISDRLAEYAQYISKDLSWHVMVGVTRSKKNKACSPTAYCVAPAS